MLYKVIFWHFGEKNRSIYHFGWDFWNFWFFSKKSFLGSILTIFRYFTYFFQNFQKFLKFSFFLIFFSFWIILNIFWVILRISGSIFLLFIKRVRNKSAPNMEILNQTFEKIVLFLMDEYFQKCNNTRCILYRYSKYSEIGQTRP